MNARVLMFDGSKTQSDNYRVHIWHNGRDKGRISCPIGSIEQAEAWISDWKSAGREFANDDLRIHGCQTASLDLETA